MYARCIVTIFFSCSLIGVQALYAFKFGLEVLSPAFIEKYQLGLRSVGLVTNQTGLDSAGNPSVVVLRQKGVNITTIFAPEHGYTGIVPAGVSVHNVVDSCTKIPIISLYSHEKGVVGKTINVETFAHVDYILFDMQDSGMRHYTYISTLMRCLEACQKFNKTLIVLDRPNLLGSRMEGPLVDPDLISFISIAPIPVRHGMTIGEIAKYFNAHLMKRPARLIVVPMQGYTRTAKGSVFFKKPLSPNLSTIDSCLGYSFLGLLGEVSPCNVGVGTRYAFRCIMLPLSIKPPVSLWWPLQQLLLQYGISSIRHTMIDERTHKKVTGLLLQFKDITHIRTFSLLLDMLMLLMKHNISLQCAPTFDKSVGTKSLRIAIENKESLEPFKHAAHRMTVDFYNNIKSIFLYQPHPYVD